MDPQTDRIRSLFDDFGVWNFAQALIIIVLLVLIYNAVKFVLPKAAELLPTRFRIAVLNAIPVLRLVLLLAGLFMVVPLLFNITLENLVLVMSTIGVALGFALKDFATSAFAGVVAVWERPYRSGDWIRIGDDYGEVIELGSRALKLRTADDDVVTIPHSRIWAENVINSNDGQASLMCVADFFVDPKQPCGLATPVLKDVALTSPFLDWTRPIAVVMENTPIGTRIRLRAYPFEIRDQFAFVSDLTDRGSDALSDNGFELLSVPDFAGST